MTLTNMYNRRERNTHSASDINGKTVT